MAGTLGGADAELTIWDTLKANLFIHDGVDGSDNAAGFGAIQQYYENAMFDPTATTGTSSNIAAYSPTFGTTDSLFAGVIDYTDQVLAKVDLLNVESLSIADLEVFINAVVDLRIFKFNPIQTADQTPAQAVAAAAAAKTDQSRISPFTASAASTAASGGSVGAANGAAAGSGGSGAPLCQTGAVNSALGGAANAATAGGTAGAVAPLDPFWYSIVAQRASPAWQGMETKEKNALRDAGTADSVTNAAVGAIVDGKFNSARLLWAYKYIDHLQLPQHGTYDGFLEFQVRQLTKVVFVARMLMAAAATADEEQKPSLVAAFNKVIGLPDVDKQMLRDFLDPQSSKHLDKLYEKNSKRSSQLHADARALEADDATMRVVQDNLRSVNSNDELVRVVRFRAFWGSIVVGVLTVALVAALYFTLFTGRLATMYTIIAAASVLVLIAEVFRGVGAILRLAI